MEIKFTAKDFCKILEKCAVSGVSEMKFADIYVKFISPDDFTPKRMIFSPDQGTSKEADEANQPTTQEFDVQTKQIMQEYEQTQMLISDPLRYEQSFIDENLRDESFATENS